MNCCPRVCAYALMGRWEEKPEPQLELLWKSLGLGRGGPMVTTCLGLQEVLARHPPLGKEDVKSTGRAVRQT